MTSLHDPNFTIYLERVQVLPQLNIQLPSVSITPVVGESFNELALADPEYYRHKKIDIILGADLYPQIILPGIKFGQVNEPIAQNSKLGWLISGPTTSTRGSVINIRCHASLLELETLVNRLYDSEQIPETKSLTLQEQWCEDYFQKTTIRKPNGVYMVRLPLKTIFDSSQTLGQSKQIALKRLYQLERRFQRNPSLSQQYAKVIDEYFQLNQITPVDDIMGNNSIPNAARHQISHCILPHHAVFKDESTTTKLRVVFDASTKTSNGRSLNDILCIGPPLQNELASVLLNWRFHKYVILADIQKMYRCIQIHPDDAQFQRILWRKDNQIQEFALTTVTFGTASAPFQAIRVLHQLADDSEIQFPLASNILRKDMYVDDVLSGGETINEVLSARDQLIAVLRSAGMELRKWASNNPKLLIAIPPEHQSNQSDLTLNNKDSIKTLGLCWSPILDHFTFTIQFDIPDKITKRSLLSMIARLFDPLGLLIPILLHAKLILKDVWKCHTAQSKDNHQNQWDDPLPDVISQRWQQFVANIHQMNSISIPRWVDTHTNLTSVEIHTFCDGSSSSYAAAVYLRVEQPTTISCHLLVAKNRVAPSKPMTIPRIELQGAVLAIELTHWVQKSLHCLKKIPKIFYWTDGSIVLHWLQADPSRWQTFVANRVNKILSKSTFSQWNHVRSSENPADCATRGMNPLQLSLFDLWWSGPNWLQKSKDHWPILSFAKGVFDAEEIEERPIRLQLHHCSIDNFILHRYSSFRKLRRVVAWILRFLNNCRSHSKVNTFTELSVAELQVSLETLIRMVQATTFAPELKAIRSSKPLPTCSKLRSLTPFIDETNILRVKGRLENSLLSYSQKHPMIMPSKHHITNLLIDQEHLNALHGGTQITLTKIRQNFWILNGRRTVANRINKCIRCFRQKPASVNQLMGNLPTPRVTPACRPFITTGVDYTGAITLKASRYRGHTIYKGYVAIFICLATKAVHLEAVTGLDTEHFLMALRRFLSRRGLCKDMYSDCGTNFTGAANILQTSQKHITSHLAEKGVQWHFNPPYSPNFGGLWEANVKSTKYHLKRVMGDSMLTYEEISTILTEIEACLNSRPLSPLSSDPNELFVLTPAHFLISDSLFALPEVHSKSKGLSARFFDHCKIVQHFWKRWSTDWLSHLQCRPKWCNAEPNLSNGELVIIREDNLPPSRWAIGRIVELHPGSDNLVRVVTLRTQSGLIKRSISKLCRFPCLEGNQNLNQGPRMDMLRCIQHQGRHVQDQDSVCTILFVTQFMYAYCL